MHGIPWGCAVYTLSLAPVKHGRGHGEKPQRYRATVGLDLPLRDRNGLG